MKRPVKLAVMAGVLAVLIAGILILNVGNERRAAEELAEMTVFTPDTEGTVRFGWEYGGDRMMFERSGDSWILSDEPDYPLDPLMVSNAFDSLSRVVAKKSFKPEEALSEYGLEEPAWKVTYITKDGSETVLSFGGETELDGYRYFSNGDGRVYLVDYSLTENFSFTLFDLAEQEQLPTMTDMKSMSVTAGDISYRIDRERPEDGEGTGSFTLVLPDSDPITLDSTAADEFVRTITYNLFWQVTEGWRCSDEELAAFGLDGPDMEVSVVYYVPEKIDTGMVADDGGPIYDTIYNEEEFRLQIGNGTDGNGHARICGSELVYLISSSVYDTLVNMTPDALN